MFYEFKFFFAVPFLSFIGLFSFKDVWDYSALSSSRFTLIAKEILSPFGVFHVHWNTQVWLNPEKRTDAVDTPFLSILTTQFMYEN
jgi:hypothetical protein